eukprot:CAMPEP_0174928454 /NCGR_PEP_ID=MMETSP1355-20121228/23542_1 /TAXON_ID=464990 /ORGANISM="Hemiselmis tepida, Strain CCMP443" /LENGTH=313 /DNA_ID=CAMNT_0016174615 /DNA_START=57 /DNA_END=995 /DNA_ORIENTATION=-
MSATAGRKEVPAKAKSVGGASRRKPAKARILKRKGIKAAPLKFFNVRASERFVFRRRDKKTLTHPPRSSLVPVFIHFSDIFPDLVQSTLDNCRALIEKCPVVYVLKPSSERESPDEVVWDGPGTLMPERCWERHGSLLRTLDLLQFKVSAPDRKKELLPIEKHLWSVLEPFLEKIRKCSEEIIQGHVDLASLGSEGLVQQALQGSAPWCVRLSAVHTEAPPTVGDQEHDLFYSPRAGLFTRRVAASSLPLMTLPCRLNSAMSAHPPLSRILDYLCSVGARIHSRTVADAVRGLAERHPVPPPGADEGGGAVVG